LFIAKYASLADGTDDAGAEVSIAGRVYAKRESSAKLVFYDLCAENGKVQILADFKAYKGEEGFEKMVETIKRGDIIGVVGTPTRTKKGELSVVPTRIVLLSPCLHALPHAHQSITDQEIRYRKRYLDLIVNPANRSKFVTRAKIVNYIRRYLDSAGSFSRSSARHRLPSLPFRLLAGCVVPCAMMIFGG
jgi:lysyl-tRNA synthetase, class II